MSLLSALEAEETTMLLGRALVLTLTSLHLCDGGPTPNQS